MEIDGRAAVARDDVDLVARPQGAGRAGQLDLDVFLGLAQDRRAVHVADGLQTHVVGHGLEAGVADGEFVAGPADDGGVDGQRAVELGDAFPVGAVHQDVGPRLHFVHARESPGDPVRPRTAAADQVHGQAALADIVGRLGEHGHGFAAAGVPFLVVRVADDVALVAHHAAEDDAGIPVDGLGESPRGFAGRHPAALHAHVDLDDHVHPGAGGDCGVGDLPDVLFMVGGDDDVRMAGEGGQAVDLDPSHDLVGHEDVPYARRRHDLGLAQLGAGDAPGARFDLPVGQDRRLVRLGMGPKMGVLAGEELRHAGDVAFHQVQVDHQGRGIDVLDRAAGAGHGSRSSKDQIRAG